MPKVRFNLTGERRGNFSLEIGGRQVGAVEIPHLWTTYGITAGLTCGYLNVPIVPACQVPAEFSENLHRVSLELLSPAQPQSGEFAALMQEE